MAIEKRGRGRPKGSGTGGEFTHQARVPMKPETWERLQAEAAKDSRSAADVVRELVDRWLKRRR